MSILLLVRLPILITLLMELKDFQVIVNTGKRMFSPFLLVLFSFYLVMFMFDCIGIVCFGGLVKLSQVSVIENSAGNALYYQLNFNDFYSGLLTLFAILVSNNWNAIAEMYCALCDNNWPKVYFSTFFVITIMVILNIVVSFVLEIYNMSLGESRAKLTKIANAKKILKVAPTQESLEELQRKAQLYD